MTTSLAPAPAGRRSAPTGVAFVVVAVVALAVGVWLGARYGRRTDGAAVAAASDLPSSQFYTVRRDDLSLSLVEHGKLHAVLSYPITPAFARSSSHKITWLVPEGSAVKAGDLLVRFDSTRLEETIELKEAELANSVRQLTVAQEELRIQQSAGKSAVAEAESRLGDAEFDLRTYVKLKAPRRLNDLDAALYDARVDLERDIEERDAARSRLRAELFLEESQRANLEKEIESWNEAVRNAQKNLDALQLERKIFRSYDYRRELERRQEARDNAKLGVDQAQVEAVSQASQKQTEVAKLRDQIARLRLEIDDLRAEVEQCELRAPIDGMVLYSDATAGRMMRSGSARLVEVGAEWYGSNPIMTIPDHSAFEIRVEIGENYRGRVEPGLEARIRVEAVSELDLQGTVERIGVLARPRYNWDPASPRVFDAVVSLAASDPRLTSGMSARVAIETATVEDVLIVPIEALYDDDGRTLCMVQTSAGVESRAVIAGRSDDHFVEIVEGLAEGDRVAVDPELRSRDG